MGDNDTDFILTDYGVQRDHSVWKRFLICNRQPTAEDVELAAKGRTLDTFFGVVVPCCLSMFSVVLFLRMGFIIGQAGLLWSLLMLVVAFSIIGLTVISISAISTNGAVEAGGAYFMISRALGPEMGASIGLMFFLANAAAVAMYIFGICETILADFGESGQLLPVNSTIIIPSGEWVEYGYSTFILLLVGMICMIGSHIYAKATFFIFLCVVGAICSSIINFFIASKNQDIPLTHPIHNMTTNTTIYTGLYSGFNQTTFHSNLKSHLSIDHHTHHVSSFSQIFSVVFCYKHSALTAMTHVLERAAKGELKNPSRSIPLGTIAASGTVCLVYIILMFFIAATCTKQLLLNNYTFLQPISFWPPIIFIGIILSSFSAALSCLIGASRVLYAMSMDGMFGPMLRLTKKTDSKGNPYVAVLVTWFIVQIILLIGEVNKIAPIVTIFFLMAYSACNLACLGLDWASAPNFRPTFKYFSWQTALAGLVSSVAVMFMVNQILAIVSVAIAIILSAVSHYTAPRVAWGSLSQALIFHQVRKYALKINIRDQSIDAWRPGILFLVRDIMPNIESLQFVNDLKKSGLLVIGHVNIGSMSESDHMGLKKKLDFWTDFVKENKIKAFVEHTTAQSLRIGSEQLLRLSGLGGMKPNTLVVNLDDTYSELSKILSDAVNLEKNIILLKNLNLFDRSVLDGSDDVFVDIWPIDLFDSVTPLETNSEHFDFNESSIFLLQIAGLLSRSAQWRKNTKLRILFPVADANCQSTLTDYVQRSLDTFRIKAEIVLARNDLLTSTKLDGDGTEINHMIRTYRSQQTVVSFYQLPKVDPLTGVEIDDKQFEKIHSVLNDTGPSILGYGLRNVMTT